MGDELAQKSMLVFPINIYRPPKPRKIIKAAIASLSCGLVFIEIGV